MLLTIAHGDAACPAPFFAFFSPICRLCYGGGHTKSKQSPDQQNSVHHGIQPFHAAFRHDRVVFYRNADLGAIPFGRAGIRKEFDREEVRGLYFECESKGIEKRDRWPNSVARVSSINNRATAPSVIIDELPAVTVPFRRSNTGLSLASASKLCSGRYPMSSATTSR